MNVQASSSSSSFTFFCGKLIRVSLCFIPPLFWKPAGTVVYTKAKKKRASTSTISENGSESALDSGGGLPFNEGRGNRQLVTDERVEFEKLLIILEGSIEESTII